MIRDVTVRQKLDELPSSSGERQRVNLVFPGAATATLDLCSLERLGGELWELAVAPAVAPAQPLLDHAKLLAARLTGLLEPLALIECDVTAGVAMLRSEEPQKQEAELAYYELMVRQDGGSTLRRYQQRQTAAREQIPYVLTREALAKGIADLANPVA